MISADSLAEAADKVDCRDPEGSAILFVLHAIGHDRIGFR
jgi:hypothetical protein